jgi:hypothetical protein
MSVVEVEVFQTKPDVSAASFQSLDDVRQAWSYVNCSGLLRRTLARNDQGHWLALSWWSSADAASATGRAREELPAWFDAVDETSYRRNTFVTAG